MRFGVQLDHDRLLALMRPDEHIQTLITADVYGTGDADKLTGEALSGLPRERYCLVGAIGHDFYSGERQGAKGYPRFTDPALRGPGEYASYIRMATERSLERIGADAFDLLLLHNPDRTGYSSPVVW
ncbi:MAG: aldo/keto reductase, partial [Thermoleophilia bacterium]|nr:aldo/keto reductase [Thermoleophilia bacterium]